MKHKHADLIHAWADGAEIQYNQNGIWFDCPNPNLGRILAAVGYAGIEDLDQTLIDLYLDDVHVATAGGRHPQYQEHDGQRVMQQAEITVRVCLGRGSASDTVWTCDLSHDYVSINADYRS